jgi:hypothetical protein
VVSKRRQVNVRLSPESEVRLAGLVARMRAALGIEVSQSDVLQAGLIELEKRYPPPPEPEPRKAPPAEPKPRPRKGGK